MSRNISTLFIVFFSLSALAQDYSKLLRQKISSTEDLTVLLDKYELTFDASVYDNKKLLFGVEEIQGFAGKSKETKLVSIFTFKGEIFRVKSVDFFNRKVDLYDDYLEDSIRLNSGVSEVTFVNQIGLLLDKFDIREYSRKPSTNPLWGAISENDISMISLWLNSFDPEAVVTAYYSLYQLGGNKSEELTARINYLNQITDVFLNLNGEEMTFNQVFEIIDTGQVWR